MLCVFICSFLFLLCSCCTAVRVQLSTGWIEGSSSDGVDSFLGVPYGIAGRWQRGREFPSWLGVRSALTYAPACAQIGAMGQEDCLFLDVYRRSGGNSSQQILTWIHGGGFFAGSSSQYRGFELTKATSAIVVVLQYRLGPFGFLPQSPNLGLFDQYLALDWVRRNAKAFGGDPSQIILAGESAGAASVLGHLSSPLSKGVGAAAALSPGPSQVLPCSALLAFGEKIFSFCNCTSVSSCSSASTQCLLDAFSQALASGPVSPFTPCIDFEFLVDAPVLSLQSFPRIPLMVGTVSCEGALLSWQTASQPPGPMRDAPQRASTIVRGIETFSGALNLTSLYPMTMGPWDALTSVWSDYAIYCLAHRVMAKVATVRYLFDSFVPGNYIYFLGSTHASDLPFWFNAPSVPNGPSSPPFLPGGNSLLALQMSRLLASFVSLQQNTSQMLLLSDKGLQNVDFPDESERCAMWIDVFKSSAYS
jgi:carboxylesterase type B